MARSDARHSFGTILARDGNTIAEISRINGLELSADTIDVSHLNSDDGYREFVQGMRDGGEVSLEGSFIPSDTAGQFGLLTDFNAGTLQDFVMTFPTAMATTWTFTAIVTGFNTGVAENEKVTFNASMKVSGKPVLGVTASNNLTALALGAGTLYPTFAAAEYEYVATVAAATDTVTATFAAGTCVLNTPVGDVALTSTVASAPIDLGGVGDVTSLKLTVTETNKTPVVYTIEAARTA